MWYLCTLWSMTPAAPPVVAAAAVVLVRGLPLLARQILLLAHSIN